MNPNGGMEIGVSDMQCHDNLPISHIHEHQEDIKNSKIVLVDTNVSEEIILETLKIAQNVNITI